MKAHVGTHTHTHIMKAGIAMGVPSLGGLTVEKILKMDSGNGCVLVDWGMVGERPHTAGGLGQLSLCVCLCLCFKTQCLFVPLPFAWHRADHLNYSRSLAP